MSVKPLAVQLGEFVAGLRFEDLPQAVVDKAKAFVNHGITIGMAGHGSAWIGMARQGPAWHGPAQPGQAGPGKERRGKARSCQASCEK